MKIVASINGVLCFLLTLAIFFFIIPSLALLQEENVEVQSENTSSQKVVVASTSPLYQIEKLPNENIFRDFVVGPGRFAIELSPGESKVVEIMISNRMGEKKRFSLTTEDMTGSQNPAEAVSLLGGESGPYTLKDYVSVPHTEFELDHAHRARIPVTVSLPPDAEPGGRYGTLLVSIVSKPIDGEDMGGAKPSSVIVSRIGTLFFVTTPGEIEQDMVFSDFETIGGKHFFTEGPITFGIVSENKGSVHTTPYGEVRIYNTLGNEVGFIELEPWFVMPKSLRLRETSWNRDFIFGRYTAVAKINRGYDNIVDERSFTFYVVPMKIIAVVFISLFIFFFTLRFVGKRFEFRRKEG